MVRKKRTWKEREKQAHRNAILDAAMTVFSEKGYYGASIEKIAEEADFSIGTIYNFFEGKSDLYACVIERMAKNFLQELSNKIAHLTKPVEQLEAIIDFRLTYFSRYQSFIRAIFESSPGRHTDPVSAIPESCKGLYETYIKQVSEVFEKGINQGVFRQYDPLYMSLCLEGIASASNMYWSRSHHLSENINQQAAMVKQILMDWIYLPRHYPDGETD